MKTFYIDFFGYCEIDANSTEEAQEIFWKIINENKPLPQNVYELDRVEEKNE